jgi:hypothetical protein
MDEQEDLKRVYTGTIVEANYIKTLLEENGIGALVRNLLQESMAGGWAYGASQDSALVFVAEYNEEKAKEIIGSYQQNKKEEDLS